MRAIGIFFALLCFLDLMREPCKKHPLLSVYLASLPPEDKWEVLDKADLNCTCGSGKKIQLKRVNDGFIYNVLISNFVLRGRRPPKRSPPKKPVKKCRTIRKSHPFLSVHLASLPENDKWEPVDKCNFQLTCGVNKQIEMRRLSDGFIYSVRLSHFVEGARPSKHGLLVAHLDSLPPDDKWEIVNPEDEQLTAGCHNVIPLRRVSDGFIYTVHVGSFALHGARPPRFTLGDYISKQDLNDLWLISEEYNNLGIKSKKKISFQRVRDNYIYECRVDHFTHGARPEGSSASELIVREYLNTYCDARFVVEKRNIHSATNYLLRHTEFQGMIIGMRELDFLFLGLKTCLEVQGQQHYQDLPFFNSLAIDQVANDYGKALELHKHGFHMLYLDTAVIRGPYDWRRVLNTTISHAVHNVLEPSVFFLRTEDSNKHQILLVRFEADDSPYRGNVYEVFITQTSCMAVVNVSTKACVTVRKLDKITLSGVLAKAEIEEV